MSTPRPRDLLLALLVGCGSPSPTPTAPGDRDAYTRAAGVRPGDAEAVCDDIGDVDLREECLAHAAARLSAAGQVDAGLEVCARLERHPWSPGELR